MSVIFFFAFSGADKTHSDNDYHFQPGAILKDVHPSELDTCTVNDSSHTHHTRNLNNFINTLRTIIPAPTEFFSQYKNPCWNSTISITNKIQKLFKHKGGSLTDTEASYIMSEMFSPDARNQRRVEQSLVCIPKVFFIGFPRSGSTQLYRMLTRHPQLVGGANKEPHWWTKFSFTAKFPHNILAVVRYLIHYQEAAKHVAQHHDSLLIDASQSTVWDTRSTKNLCILPTLISSLVPSAKYIVLMRDPVARLYSDFTYICSEYWRVHKAQPPSQYTKHSPEMFHTAVQRELQGFQKCLESHPLDVCTHFALQGSEDKSVSGCGRVRLGISLYFVHLVKWLKAIPRENFLLLRTDDLEKDPYAILKKIWKFLELPPQSTVELQDILYNHTHSNLLSQTRMQPQTQQMLQEFFKPYNRKLAELLKDDKYLWQDRS